MPREAVQYLADAEWLCAATARLVLQQWWCRLAAAAIFARVDARLLVCAHGRRLRTS
jgi:hypothetical protein